VIQARGRAGFSHPSGRKGSGAQALSVGAEMQPQKPSLALCSDEVFGGVSRSDAWLWGSACCPQTLCAQCLVLGRAVLGHLPHEEKASSATVATPEDRLRTGR